MRQLIAVTLVLFSINSSAHASDSGGLDVPPSLVDASETYYPYTCRAFDSWGNDVHGSHAAAGPSLDAARAAALQGCFAYHSSCAVTCASKP